jgi:hypothetical protein
MKTIAGCNSLDYKMDLYIMNAQPIIKNYNAKWKKNMFFESFAQESHSKFSVIN